MVLQQQATEFQNRQMATAAITAEARKRSSTSGDSSVHKKVIVGNEYATKEYVGALVMQSKVLNYLKENRKLLSLDEILEKLKEKQPNIHVTSKCKYELSVDLLPSNPKIECIDGKYKFKPEITFSSKSELISIIENQFEKGTKALSKSILEEAVGTKNLDMFLKSTTSKDMTLITGTDKELYLFKKVVGMDHSVDDEYCKFWRSSSVDGLSESGITDFLKKNNIQAFDCKVIKPIQRKIKTKTKKRTVKKANEHVTLIDYREEQ